MFTKVAIYNLLIFVCSSKKIDKKQIGNLITTTSYFRKRACSFWQNILKEMTPKCNDHSDFARDQSIKNW